MSLSPSDIGFYISSPHGKMPERKGSQAAGFDIYSAESKIIHARSRELFHTGVHAILPEGTYGRIAPRSSLAVNFGIDVGAGVVDNDYTGEILILLFNHSDYPVTINIGDRIAQLIVTFISTGMARPFWEAEWLERQEKSERGARGFGSTGLNDNKKQ